jgi:starch synthase (maltosyl-transferring)
VIGRIVIDNVHPRTPTGAYPAKAVVGEVVVVSADIFRDGHDVLGAQVRWRPRTANGAGEGGGRGGKWAASPMTPVGNDRWEAVIEPTTLGPHELVVEAWTDAYATWRHKVTTKLDAGQEIDVELEEGARLLESRVRRSPAEERQRLRAAVSSLRSLRAAGGEGTAKETEKRVNEHLAPALDPVVADLLAGPERPRDLTRSRPCPLWVDRERALVGAWYEVFPRSEGGLAGTAERLPAIAEMGFDVLYLPPVHPIGRTFRKGRGNTLVAGPDDPGSPWAIGGPEGGHTALHPDLGTFEDFHALVARADELGMEVALDYALQCSPDHPWVTEHPEWFHHRPDGTIAYAENPPKKYQDIYPINFWPERDADREALWEECRRILEFWIGHGIRFFRVDNPHTKPMAFWEWLIPTVQAAHPEVLFLAEAFTRPKVMAKLAEVGFSQSYTYFTWRNSAWELTDYLTELTAGPVADYMRPNFWPNTPDILSGPLRGGSPAAFKMRLLLAATMVPSYGIYSGYELYENEPASEANEEYGDSEKYEIKRRDWSRPDSLAPWIAILNAARRRHPAFSRLRNLSFHHSDNPSIVAYAKQTEDGSDVVLMAVNLDPDRVQETTLGLDLGALGLPRDAPFEAYDELTGRAFTWQGERPYVRLDPAVEPAHLLHLRAPK